MNLTRTLAIFLFATLLCVPSAFSSNDQQTSKVLVTPSAEDSHKTPPKFLAGKEPSYTESARTAKVEGTVILTLSINDKGRVTAAKVLNPLDKGLDRNAVHAVKKWKFAPATVDGKPVATEVNVSVDFRLLD